MKVKKKMTCHARRKMMVEKVSNGCWWVRLYLNDRCGIKKSL